MGERSKTLFPAQWLIVSLWFCWGWAEVRAEDWPQWRGKDREGRWHETETVERFSEGGLSVRWRATVGPGYSGPVVSGGSVFVTDRQRDRNTERVLAFEEGSGRLLWIHEYPAHYDGVDYDNGPRASPTVDGSRVYTLGTMGHLFCLRVTDGSVVWKKDLVSEYNSKVPGWGISSAPLVEGPLLVAVVGGESGAGLVAFGKRTGREAWRALSDGAGYSAPIALNAGGVRQLIFWSPQALNSLDPETGKEYWRIPFRSKADMSIVTPVRYQDYLFVSSFYEGAMMVKLHRERPEATVLWKEPRSTEMDTLIVHCLMSTPYFKDEHFYAIDSYGELRCLESSTGKRVWETLAHVRKDRWANAHLTPNRDRVFLFNEHGELILAELSPRGYHEISRTQLLDPTQGVEGLRPVAWAHPAYANQHIFVRNDEELIRVSLAVSD